MRQLDKLTDKQTNIGGAVPSIIKNMYYLESLTRQALPPVISSKRK